MRYISASAVLAVLTLAGGCTTDPTEGYTLTSQYPRNIKTVAVPIWVRGKDVYRRGLEFRLTEAIVKRIELDTPYKVTAKSRADTILTGSINNINQQVVSYNPDTGAPRELVVTFTVSFQWRDLRTGEVLVDKPSMLVTGTYIPPAPLSEDFFQGAEDTINRLAKRVVEHMESEW